MNMKLSTNQKFNRMFANILSIAVILAMMFPATAFAQESTARIVASEAGDWFWTTDFQAGTLYLFIYESGEEGAALLWSGNKEADESGFLVAGYEDHGQDLVPGNYLVVTDGATEKGLVLESITMNVFDPENEVIAGTAPGRREVLVVAGMAEAETQASINLIAKPKSGAWKADFSKLDFDITEDMRPWSFAQIFDEDGDANEAGAPPLTNPRFTIFPEWEWFDGWDWPNGATVTITVKGKPECKTSKQSWGYFFNGGFPEGCDVVIGDTVTFGTGHTVRTHTVQNLAISSVDKVTNRVAGTANVGTLIYAWIHGVDQSELQLTVADGTWLADFGSHGFDLVENMGGRAEIRDEMGNATAVDWWIPNPRFVVFPEWEWFDGIDWPDGVPVTITVAGKDDCSTEGVSSGNFFNGGFPDGCDIAFGDTVTFTDGVTTRTHIVEDLVVTGVNPQAETVSGTAAAGKQIHVWVHEHGESEVQPIADGDGNWTANFTEVGFDLQAGMNGRSEIRDAEGNATAVDWHVSNPLIVASITENWFYLSEFAPNVSPDLFVYESQGGPLVWEGTAPTDDTGHAWVDAEGRWDLEPGMYLVASDGTSTKDLVIEGFTFDVFDVTQGLLQGTAPEPFGRRIWVGIGWENDGWSMDVTTDKKGDWSADFGAPVPGGYWWVAAQIFDEDGDASELRPALVVNWALYVTSTQDLIANDGVCTLREAVIAANTNRPSGDMNGECSGGTDYYTDTIVLAADQTYSLSLDSTYENDSVDGDLDIWNNSAATDLVIMVEGNGKATISQDAAVDDRVLENHGATVQIEDLILSGGSGVEDGGGLRNDGAFHMDASEIKENAATWGGGVMNLGPLTAVKSVISNNTATYGGGIWSMGNLTIDKSTLSNNSASYGGAIVNRPDTMLTVTASTITDNWASDEGGGLVNRPNGTASVESSIISGNTTDGSGGGLLNQGMLAVYDSVISGNSASGDGGGLSNSAILNITDSTVTENHATWSGGGIINWPDGTLTLDNSTVSDNTVNNDYGGGIHNMAIATIQNKSVIAGNSAHDGGGLSNDNAGTLTVDSSTITKNNATSSGGGIVNWNGGTLVLNNSTVSNNQATNAYGGGIISVENGMVTIDVSKISNNTAGDHGGGLVNWGGTMTVAESKVSDNMAPWGGGIFNQSGTLTLDASEVTHNTAINDAGGIFIKELSIVNIQNDSVISDNTAAWGGGISSWNSTLTIDASTLSSNSVSNSGGGLLVHDGGTASIQNKSVISGNTANWDAGISNWGGSTLTVDSSTISNNMASGSSGGIGNGGTLILNASTISNNTAPWGGGLGNSGDVQIDASIISGNSATGGGSGLLHWAGTLTVTGSALLGNMSDGNGDAIYTAVNAPNSMSVTGSCISGNGDIAIFNDQPASQNFTGNWWGDTSGPSGAGLGSGDSVSDFIDFSGWLNEAPSICAP